MGLDLGFGVHLGFLVYGPGYNRFSFDVEDPQDVAARGCFQVQGGP